MDSRTAVEPTPPIKSETRPHLPEMMNERQVAEFLNMSVASVREAEFASEFSFREAILLICSRKLYRFSFVPLFTGVATGL